MIVENKKVIKLANKALERSQKYALALNKFYFNEIKSDKVDIALEKRDVAIKELETPLVIAMSTDKKIDYQGWLKSNAHILKHTESEQKTTRNQAEFIEHIQNRTKEFIQFKDKLINKWPYRSFNVSYINSDKKTQKQSEKLNEIIEEIALSIIDKAYKKSSVVGNLDRFFDYRMQINIRTLINDEFNKKSSRKNIIKKIELQLQAHAAGFESLAYERYITQQNEPVYAEVDENPVRANEPTYAEVYDKIDRAQSELEENWSITSSFEFDEGSVIETHIYAKIDENRHNAKSSASGIDKPIEEEHRYGKKRKIEKEEHRNEKRRKMDKEKVHVNIGENHNNIDIPNKKEEFRFAGINKKQRTSPVPCSPPKLPDNISKPVLENGDINAVNGSKIPTNKGSAPLNDTISKDLKQEVSQIMRKNIKLEKQPVNMTVQSKTKTNNIGKF